MMFVTEVLIFGASMVGCVGCWAAVQKHKITSELQKHKIDADYKIMNPPPEPREELPEERPSPAQQSLSQLLERRRTLESNISELRQQACQYSQNEGKKYEVWRVDTLKALEDARAEQQELVLEETGLLEMMHGVKNEDSNSTAQSVQSPTGRRISQRVDDSSDMCDAELHDEEASRESTA